jgi:hypothetical protein
MYRPFPPLSLRRFIGSHSTAELLAEKQLTMALRDGVRALETVTVEWTREEILREARKATTSVTAEATKGALLSHNQGTLRARDIRRLLIGLLEGDPGLLQQCVRVAEFCPSQKIVPHLFPRKRKDSLFFTPGLFYFSFTFSKCALLPLYLVL